MPIMLPKYTWADGEIGTYFFRYNHEPDLLNLELVVDKNNKGTKVLSGPSRYCPIGCYSSYGVCVYKLRMNEQGFLLHV